MQPTHRSSRILQPVKLWFVYLSLFVALVLSYVPTGRVPGVPDWMALVLAFWCVREPMRVSMGTAFFCGLLVDLGHGAALGQHALAYVVLAHLAGRVSRRVLWFQPFEQALVFPSAWAFGVPRRQAAACSGRCAKSGYLLRREPQAR